MGIIVDLIIIVCLVVFIIIGYVKGLTGSLLKLASFALAVVLAIVLYKPITNLIINETSIDEKMETSIIQMFSKQETQEQLKENEESGITNNIINNINKDIENATAQAKDNIVKQSANKITRTIINLGCAIIIFLGVRIILLIVSFFIKGVSDLPVIKQIDKIGGIVYGLIEGIIIIFVILSIISFSNILWTGNTISSAIEESVIGSILYNNNILLNIIF